MTINSMEYMGNITWEEIEYLSAEKLAGLFIGLDIVTMLLIIVGNGAVLYLVGRYKRLRTTTNYHIVSLCISDILVAVISVPLQILGHFSSKFLTTDLCKVVEFIDFVALAANIFCVVAVAFDRHQVVVHSMTRRTNVSKCFRIISLVWLLSALYGLRAVLVYDVTITKHLINNVWTDYYLCDIPKTNLSINGYLIILDCIALYVVPLGIILLLYVQIFLSVHRGTSLEHTAHAARKRKWKVTKMLLMVVVMFAVCQLPVHVLHIVLYWGTGPFPGYLLVTETVELLSFSNGWLNVIAYVLFNDSFSKQIFKCKRFRRVAPQITTIERVTAPNATCS